MLKYFEKWWIGYPKLDFRGLGISQKMGFWYDLNGFSSFLACFMIIQSFAMLSFTFKNHEKWRKTPFNLQTHFSITLATSKKTEDRNQVLCFCAKSSSFALTEIWFDSIWLLVESTWSAWRQALVVLYELFIYIRT